MLRRLVAVVVLLGLVAGAVALRLGYDDWRTDRTQVGLQQELALGTAPRPVVREDAPVPVASRSAYKKPFAELRIPRFGDGLGVGRRRGHRRPGTRSSVPGTTRARRCRARRATRPSPAHRAGHGDPFIDFDLTSAGATAVEITQGDTTWVYRLVREPWIVGPPTPTTCSTRCRVASSPSRPAGPSTARPKRLIAVAELDDVLVDGRSTLSGPARRRRRAGAALSAAPVASP